LDPKESFEKCSFGLRRLWSCPTTEAKIGVREWNGLFCNELKDSGHTRGEKDLDLGVKGSCKLSLAAPTAIRGAFFALF